MNCIPSVLRTTLLSCLTLLWLAISAPAWSLGGDFSLQDGNGHPYSLADSRGRVVIMAFGYTFCPDVCPTGLATIAAALRQLGDDADDVDPLFISLDPERDTPEVLREYAQFFHPRMRGLTGTAEQLRRVAALYRVRYAFVGKGSGPRYTMDHSANLYVVDASGALVRILPHGLPADAVADALREAISRGSSRVRTTTAPR